MPLVLSQKWLAYMIPVAFWLILASSFASALQEVPQRPIRAEDAIAMRRIVNASCPSGDAPTSPAGQYSPDGKQYALVLSRGNLERNVNEYSLATLGITNLKTGEKPRTLVTIDSPTEQGIQEVCWAKDNRTILFIGMRTKLDSGMYSVDTLTGSIRRITPKSLLVVHYAVAQQRNAFVLICNVNSQHADEVVQPDKPFVVKDQTLVELLQGKPIPRQEFAVYWMTGHKLPARIWQGINLDSRFLELSPSGRFVVVCQRLRANDLHKEWENYDYKEYNEIVKPLFGRATGDLPVPLQMYKVIDRRNDRTYPLWNAPRLTIGHQQMKWLPDEKTVILRSVILPKNVSSSSTQVSDKSQNADVTLNLENGKWALDPGVDWSPATFRAHAVQIQVEQTLNDPPHLTAKDLAEKTIYRYDINPEFTQLKFGKVETVVWQVDGISVKCGLYLPPDYKDGTRYPLVIQTHGFEPGNFSMDGREEWSSAFAARLLAARGIAVLQAERLVNEHDRKRIEKEPTLGFTPEERDRTFQMHVFEGAIDQLDRQKIIDRQRVGISGFSATVWTSEYTLTHSKHPFKTAYLVDGIDGGYFSYLAFRVTEYEADNGGKAPFGDKGISLWREEAPGFNLDRVHCPVRLVSFGASYSLLQHWEWYSGLRLLQKPVELRVFPTENHILVKPRQRFDQMDDIVRWFSFWLQDGQESGADLKDVPPEWAAMKAAIPNQKDAHPSGLPR